MSVLQRIERRIGNMRTMLTLFGIDTATFTQVDDGVTFTSSMRACQACASEALCTGWLSRAGDAINRVPEFCPNAQRFSHAKVLMDAQGRMH